MEYKGIKLSYKDFLYFIISSVLVILCLIKHVDYMFTLCLISYTAILFLSFKNYKQNIVFCSFLLTLFAFLLGSPVATLLLGSDYDVHFSNDEKHHFYLTLFISIICVGIGYAIFSKKKMKRNLKTTSESLRNSLKNTSKIVFYLTYALKIIQYIEIGYYVVRYGYMYFYTEYQSSLPLIIEKIADLYVVALSVFLATNPSKKECTPILVLFIIGGGVSLLTGKRYEFVYVFLLCFIYFVLRSIKTTEGRLEKWISPQKIRWLVICVPFLILFLMFMGAARSKENFEFVSLKDVVLDFMVDIGNSGKVIMRGYQYKDSIPHGRFYSFGSIIEYVKYNYFSSKVLGVTVPNPRSVEYVNTGHSFAYIITYLFSTESFFSGHGQGSSYIAELFADFGYIGVAIGSFALGVFIKKVFTYSNKSVFHDAFLLFLIRPLLFIPRDTYCLPLSYLFNFKYLAAFAFIYFIAQSQSKKNNGDLK